MGRRVRVWSRHALLLAGFCFASPNPCLWGQQTSLDETLSGQISALNAALIRAVSSQPEGSITIGILLNSRARLLAALIEADPGGALRMGLPAELSAQLRKISPEAEIESQGQWEGILEGTVADDFERHQSRTQWYLRTRGDRFEVYFADRATPSAGSTVRLSGVSAAHRIAAASLAVVSNAAAGQQCSTTGTQNIAVLMVTMPSNRTFPAAITASSLRQAFFGSSSDAHATDSLSGYWREMSNGQTSAAGQVFGPFALNQDFTCEQSNQILSAAINAADSTVDLTQFTHIALIFPFSASCSYAGLDTLGCNAVSSPNRGSFQASTGWFPQSPLAQPNIPLYVHELGHGLGLDHSSTEDYGSVPLGPTNQPGATVEYGDPFSVMGYPNNGFGPSGQYTGQHKSQILHWLVQPDDYREVWSPGTFTLAPYETSGLRALRVLRDPATGAWLWLEYRQPIGDVDKNLQGLPNSNLFKGALIHYEDPAMDNSHTYLLDFNPVSAPNDFRDAALAAGLSWSDPYSALTLTVNSANADGLNVSVAYDTPCASLQFSSTVFDASGGSGTITVTGGAGCRWTASGSSWITFTGPASGVGNGSIRFLVTANSGQQQRNGTISAGRQNIMIVQTGANGITMWNVAPGSGAGASGKFIFQVSDATGFGNIDYVNLFFDSGCQIQVHPAGNFLLIGGDNYLSLSTGGSSATGGKCTVYSTGTSIAGSGTQLAITVQVAFDASYAGTHQISGEVYSTGGRNSPTVTLGTWMAVAAAPALSIVKTHRGSFSQGQSGATYTVTVSNANGAGPTGGTVTVTETVPAEMTLASMAGQGWTCPGGGTCTRSDALAGGASYPPIAVKVNVGTGVTSPLVNSVSISGGGSPGSSATDSTAINPAGLRFSPTTPCRVSDTRKCGPRGRRSPPYPR